MPGRTRALPWNPRNQLCFPLKSSRFIYLLIYFTANFSIRQQEAIREVSPKLAKLLRLPVTEIDGPERAARPGLAGGEGNELPGPGPASACERGGAGSDGLFLSR